MMPIPPWLAIATAMAASVTVSMLALTMGMPRVMCRERRVAVDTCRREGTSERLGTSSTSSYVSPCGRKSAIVMLPDSVSDCSQMAPPSVAPTMVTPRPAPLYRYPIYITSLVFAERDDDISAVGKGHGAASRVVHRAPLVFTTVTAGARLAALSRSPFFVPDTEEADEAMAVVAGDGIDEQDTTGEGSSARDQSSAHRC